MVFVAQKKDVSVGGGASCFLGTQCTVREADVGRARYFGYVGKDIVTATCSVVGIEADVTESNVVGTADFNDMVAGIGGIEHHYRLFDSTIDGCKGNGVGIVDTVDGTEIDLLVEGFFAETESDGTGDTCSIKTLDGFIDGGEVTARTGTDDILVSAETDVDGAMDSIVGEDRVARYLNNGSDSVETRFKQCAEHGNLTGIAHGERRG